MSAFLSQSRSPGSPLSLRGVRVGAKLGPIDLELPGGAYGCVLGPQGAGKATLLRAIGGLARAEGLITLGGTAQHGRRRGMALVTRNGTLLPHGSVAAALRFALALAGLPKTRLPTLLDEFMLDGAAAPQELSPDATLRARLAVALAANPALLLLEDLLADVDDRISAIDLLRAATRQRGTTVLHTMRRREDAFALADHLILMEQGRILQAGPAAALYERPDTLFIARRLGPANILPGRITQIENDVASVRLDCGPLIDANPPDTDQPVPTEGLPCQVLLRPERVSVSPIPAGELGGNAIAAILRDVSHMGDTLRLRLAIGTDADIIVARPAALGTRGLAPGRTVSVAWQSSHVLTFLTEPC